MAADAGDVNDHWKPSRDGDEVAALVDSARRGDRDAYGSLYVRFGKLVNAVLLAHSHPDDVPDLVHDVFLHAWSKLDSLRDPSAFGSWIAQVARNMAKMKRRSALTLVPLDDQMPAAQEDDPADALDGQRILAAVRDLPEAYREALLLRLIEGMSGAEIAQRTGLTPGSVRVNLHRGMAMLRQKLGGPNERA
jgi:RNA polymerase sigma-70 factor (ECF subfamily)